MIALFVWQRLLILLVGTTITQQDMRRPGQQRAVSCAWQSTRPRLTRLALQRPAHACAPPKLTGWVHFRVRRSSRCTAGQSSIHWGTSPT